MRYLFLTLLILIASCEDDKGYKTAPAWGSVVNEKCVKGVIYYNAYNRMAPAFKPDGTLYTCDKQGE